MLKLITATTCLLLSSSVFADNCPAVNEIKSSKAPHWKAFDSDNGKVLSAARQAKLKNAIVKFALAEWSNSSDKNTMHCYYNNAHGSSMEAYFAKDSVLPLKSSKYWYKVTGMMQCAAGADKCQFQSLPDMRHQLASKES